MRINCIIVDDEPAALNLLNTYVAQSAFLHLVGKFDNAIDALREIHRDESIQLIFLDIYMPDFSGIELARITDQSMRRKTLRIIFTTAYDQYALEGFRVDALDYLLKPFNYVDFLKAANRALEYFQLLEVNPQPGVRPGGYTDEHSYIYLKIEHQLVKVDIEDILYVEGMKDYVKVFLKNRDRPLVTHSSLKKVEEKLPADIFMRIHRSFIVSTRAISSATKTSVLIGSATILVSEQYREIFNNWLNKWTL